MKSTPTVLVASPVAALALACGTPTQPGHTFEVVEEEGIAVAVSSAIPAHAGELFAYEKELVIRPDPGRPESLLYEPFSFAAGDDGHYYVADRGNHRVAVFDSEGRFVRAFGREGQGPGELRNPLLVEVRAGEVLVMADRTSRFRSDGTFIDQVAGGRFARPAGDGRIVIEGSTNETGADGMRRVGARVRVTDEAGDVLATVETATVPRSPTLQFSAEPSVHLLRGGEIVATSGIEPVVSWYDLGGNVLRRARIELPPEPVADDDHEAVDEVWSRFIAAYSVSEGAEAAALLEQLKAQTTYPDAKGYWTWPIIDDLGRIWLPAPVAQVPMSIDGTAPVAAARSFRVLDTDGRFLGVTTWPADAVIVRGSMIARGRLLTMVWDDEAGEILPTVYRILPAVEGRETP